MDGFALDEASDSPADSPAQVVEEERVSTRVAKRKRARFLPQPPVVTPTFRLLDISGDNEEEEEEGDDGKEEQPKDTSPPKKGNIQEEEEAASQKDDLEDEGEEDEDEESAPMSIFSDSSVDNEEAEEPAKEVHETPSRKRTRTDKHEEGDEQDEPRAKRTKKEATDEQDEEEETGKGQRMGRRGHNITSRFTELSKKWSAQTLFPKNMMPNLMRGARILDRSMREFEKAHRDADNNDDLQAESDDEEIRFTKEAIPVLENFVGIRLEQIMRDAGQMHRHRGKKRMTASDVQLAIGANPIYEQFNTAKYLDGHRNDAPAFVAFSDYLRVGKSKSKTQRSVFQHTDVEEKL